MIIELIIATATLFASTLTLYSGFGLSTLLMPIFTIFFPVITAVALAGLIHLINNILKLLLLWREIYWPIAMNFGIPALIATIPGAWLLNTITILPRLYEYNIGTFTAAITPIKLVIGILLIIFATIEWIASIKKIRLPTYALPIGGILSGFFGGLSGHQGALRTIFLTNVNLTTKQFIATNAAIAIIIDLTRLSIYGINVNLLMQHVRWSIILTAILASTGGVIIGNMFIRKITIKYIQKLVTLMLYCFGLLLILGII